jgi:hypothetical protein
VTTVEASHFVAAPIVSANEIASTPFAVRGLGIDICMFSTAYKIVVINYAIVARVAYRHLQNLENLGLLQKNTYGEYTAKEKANIRGTPLDRQNLIAQTFVLLLLHCHTKRQNRIVTIRFLLKEPLEIRYMFLTSITIFATSLFLFEGIMLFLRTRNG